MSKFYIVFVALIGLYVPSAAWSLPCLGILEKKWICEAERRTKENTEKCAAQSRKQCKPIADRAIADRSGKAEDEYHECWDKAQCACMRAHGYTDCSPSRRD